MNIGPLEDCIATLGDHLPEAVCEGDPTIAVALLHGIREARKQLAQVEAVWESYVAGLITQKRVELPGFVVEIKGGTVRKEWDHSRLAATVARESALRLSDGDQELAEFAETVSAALLEHAAISYWRAGTLRAFGLQVDDFCESERGRRTVHVTAGAA